MTFNNLDLFVLPMAQFKWHIISYFIQASPRPLVLMERQKSKWVGR